MMIPCEVFVQRFWSLHGDRLIVADDAATRLCKSRVAMNVHDTLFISSVTRGSCLRHGCVTFASCLHYVWFLWVSYSGHC